jgi:hypothetical protein
MVAGFIFLIGDPADPGSMRQASGFTTVAWMPLGPI